MALEAVIAMRVPAATAQKLRRPARADDRTLGAFCRRLLMDAAAKVPDEELSV